MWQSGSKEMQHGAKVVYFNMVARQPFIKYSNHAYLLVVSLSFDFGVVTLCTVVLPAALCLCCCRREKGASRSWTAFLNGDIAYLQTSSITHTKSE